MNREDYALFRSPVISRRLCTCLGFALFAACATGALNISHSNEGWSFGPASAHARGGDDGGGHGGGDDNGGDDNGGNDNGGNDNGGNGNGGDRGGSDDRGGDDHGGGRGSDDGPGDDHGGRGGDDGRGDDRGGRGADDKGRDDHGDRGRGRDDEPGDDRGRNGRGRDDARASPTGPVGAPGGAVSRVERSAAGFEVEYANGWKVEVENGRYEVKNPAGRTVEQRPATSADLARFRGL